MSGIGGTDLETGIGALLQIVSHFPTAYRDVGKNIASLPPEKQEMILKGLNFSTSVLGLTELGAVSGAAGAGMAGATVAAGYLGGAAAVLGAASIGPMLVMGSYYKVAKPEEKIFGIPAWIAYYLFAALACVGPAGRVGAYVKGTAEISDIAVLSNNYSRIRNSLGLKELGIISDEAAKNINTISSSGKNSGTLKDLFEFCKKFPEISALKDGKFVSSKGGFYWVTNTGDVLKNPNTGKEILFSSDVKNFIIYATKNRPTLMKYWSWYAGMPGKFGKLLAGVGFTFDAITVNTTIADILSIDPDVTEELPVNQDVSIAQIVSGNATESLVYDIYSTILEINPAVDSMSGSSPNSGIVYDYQTKRQLNVDMTKFGPLLTDNFKSKPENLQNPNLKFDPENCGLLIVDKTVFSNFDYLIKYPQVLKKYADSRRLICVKFNRGIFGLLLINTAADLASTK